MENRTRYAVDVTGGGRSSANGTTPCKTNCPCTSAADMERRQGVGAGAGHHGGISPAAPRGNKNAPKLSAAAAQGQAENRPPPSCALLHLLPWSWFAHAHSVRILSSVKPSGFAVRPARLCGDLLEAAMRVVSGR